MGVPRWGGGEALDLAVNRVPVQSLAPESGVAVPEPSCCSGSALMPRLVRRGGKGASRGRSLRESCQQRGVSVLGPSGFASACSDQMGFPIACVKCTLKRLDPYV